MTTDKQDRYFFDQDNDSHWYLIKAANQAQWEKWLELDPDNPKSWHPPKYASELGSHPNRVTFTDPK